MTTETWRKYFDFSPIDKNRTNGLCLLCHRNYKDKSGIYSNFLKHIKRAHPVEYNRVLSNGEDECLEDSSSCGNDEIQCDLMDTKHKENRIILSITKNLIIRCNMPFSLVENPAFRDFMKDCGVKFRSISNKRLKREIIPSLANVIRKRITDSLINVDYITLTIDVWSNRRCHSFLGVTCHFIDEKMLPRAYLIDLIRFRSPHNYEAINQLTQEALERFNIQSKIFRIVTDNASSMKKAYQFGLGKYAETSLHNETNSLLFGVEPILDEFQGE